MILAATTGKVQELLASAICQQYPCTLNITPQLLGINTIGRSIDTDNTNYLNGVKVTTSVLGGQVVSMSVYVAGPLDAPAARRQFQVGLYTDDNGYPGQLLGVSQVGQLQANSWNTLLIAGTPLKPLTSYWLMSANSSTQSGTNRLVYEMAGGGAGAWSSLPVPFGVWPLTFPAVLSNFQFSIKATVLP